ncbi:MULTISPECIES: DUF5381 family protein [unclassified Cytobacillus]|nr:DUF5381 family protein [Cytobacillus sp. AMY 15.2]MCM3093756.1 YfjD family protein [Cytobacillus sp. AMY 15.2]
MLIETFDDNKVRIRTYNLIDDGDFQVIVNKYIFPFIQEDMGSENRFR